MKIEENMENLLETIRKETDKDLKSRVTDKLVQLLIENGVKIDGDIIEYSRVTALKYNRAISINGLDFSEHDKQFKDKISELEEIINTKLGRWDKYGLSFSQILEMQEKSEKYDKGMLVSLPENPIDIAKMLIDKPDKYSVSDLRQIAQHLLIYCDNAPEDEE